jgi:hypothetical protein
MGVFSENAIIGASAAGDYDIEQSLRFEDGGPAYLSRTPSSAGNRKTWTWSSWVKLASSSSHQNIFCFGAANTDQVTLAINSNKQLSYSVIVSNTTTVEYVTEQQFRDPISWYHIMVTGDTTPGSPLFKVYINGVQTTSFATSTNSAAQNLDTEANNTVVHRIGERAFSSSQPFDGYLAEVHWIDGQALTPASFGETNSDTNQWVPIEVTGITYGTNGFYLPFSTAALASSFTDSSSSSHTITANGDVSHSRAQKKIGNSSIKFDGTGDYLSSADSNDWSFGTGDFTLEAYVRFNDSAGSENLFSQYQGGSNRWYLHADLTNNTLGFYDAGSGMDIEQTVVTWVADTWYHVAMVRNSGTVTYYVNGTAYTITGTNPNGNITSNTGALQIGQYDSGTNLNGYMDEIRISNSARYTGAFTPTTTAFASDANTKLLIHSDFSGGLASDSSGNQNDFIPKDITVYDQVKDSPTNNFATLNSLQSNTGGYANTFSEGNLKNNVTTGGQSYPSTFYAPPLDQKWYWECYIVSGNAAKGPAVHLNMDWTSGYENQKAYTWKWEGSNGITYNVLNSGSYTVANSTLTTNGDIFAIFIDGADIKFYKNGSLTYTATGVITTANSNVMIPSSTSADGTVYVMNFGQDSSFAGEKTSGSANATDANGYGDFYYTPPAGALACCSKNISEPSIVDPTEHFVATTYAGTGSTQTVNTGFAPDLAWVKRRDASGFHIWTDTVRGAEKYIVSNSSDNESTGGSQLINAFTSSGFTVGTEAAVNASGGTHVGWSWKGGGSAVSNTDGSLTTQVSANPTAGFSIVTYTGGAANSTIGHGLSQAPELCVFKKRNANGGDGVREWAAWHEYCTTGGTYKKGLVWSSTNAEFDAYYANSPPTASIFKLYENYQEQNFSGDDYVAYFWHSVEGYSKVGMYVGNANTDGPFVHTGFKPAFIILRNRDTGGGGYNWVINDNKRVGYNTDNKRLRVNSQGLEDDTGRLSIFSNGFKLTQTYNEANQSGSTFVYIAIAETAYKYANPY